MKLVTYNREGVATVGVLAADEARVTPVTDLVPDFRGDMVTLIERYAELRPQLDGAAEGRETLQPGALLAPIPLPRRNVFCVGKNYYAHAREFGGSGFDRSAGPGEDIPEVPVVFTKVANAVIGPDAAIRHPGAVSDQLDYEVELTAIVGRGGRGIRKEDAYDHVWGYTIINDVTARDLQKMHKQWFLGKSLDTFCPMGPWAVTAEEVEPENLEVRCWVNGELRQEANTRDLIFDIPTIIATISAGITLQPGDLIATGTPAGVGIGFRPPRFLQRGDEVSMSIGSLGTLRNRVS